MEPKPQSGSGNLLGEDHLRLHSPGLTYGEVQAPRKEAEGRRVPPRAQHCRTPQDQGGKKHRAASSHSSRALTRTLPHSQHQNTPSQTMWDLPGWEFSINLVSTWLNANVKQWNWAGYSLEGRSIIISGGSLLNSHCVTFDSYFVSVTKGTIQLWMFFILLLICLVLWVKPGDWLGVPNRTELTFLCLSCLC